MKDISFTRKELENMDGWRCTFRHIIAIASPLDRVVCLMKNPGKKPGYFWKMPGMMAADPVNLDALRQSIEAGRLELVDGKLPPGLNKKKVKKKTKVA
jgi:hypothetical protein